MSRITSASTASTALAALVLISLAACAPPARQANAPPAVSTTAARLPEPVLTDPETMAQDADAVCDLVMEPAQIVPRPADEPDYHARAVANVNEVLAGMNDDLLACYKKRVAVAPQAHAFLTTDIVIGQDGRVVRVETTGGALLGDAALGCIVHRIEKGTFAPPHGGGTLTVHVPFNMRKVTPGEAP
jgi:hypothetical protein